ncbi:MAG: hypothetical protein LIO77_08430 [Rikenellaceae bacterium]|nr:hypothetical protein [Rikenellaceae bacterium]
MKYQLLFENFIGMVSESVPQNTKISAVLADILQIEKEAVYRRLRMEVPFTFSEIATVAQSLGLSLDNIIGSIPKKSRPLKMTLVDFLNPSEVDYLMMENFIILLRQLASQPGSELGANCNMLPQAVYYKYEHLTKFLIFKWAYFTGNAGSVVPYSDISICDRVRKNQLAHMEEVRNFSVSNFIWDKNCFLYLVDDIKHFSSIYLLKPDEVENIKNDLLALIAEMEQIACNGCYGDTGKKVNFYVSNISFDTAYEYYENPNNKLGLIRTFLLNGTASMEERSFDKIKGWINSMKRVSTLISETGEKQRVVFFGKQRELITGI